MKYKNGYIDNEDFLESLVSLNKEKKLVVYIVTYNKERQGNEKREKRMESKTRR